MAGKIPGTRYIRRQSPLPLRAERISPVGALSLFCGSASQELGAEIAGHVGVAPGRYTRTVFSNENILIQLNESVRGHDVYLIQTMAAPVHDNLMELLIMIDTLKRDSASRINVVVPYLPYSRSDKKDQPRVGIAARLVANLIEVAGADRYITIDLHAGQIQGFFNIPGDSLSAFYLLSDYVAGQKIEDLVVVAVDLGFAKHARNWAERLGAPLAIIEKRRVDNSEQPEVLSLIGEVAGRNALLVDGEVLTAGSAVNTVQAIREYGARDVYFAFTHALMSAQGYRRLAELDLKQIFCTNTIPVPAQRRLPNMTVLSVAPMLGEVIMRAHEGRSVGELFDE